MDQSKSYRIETEAAHALAEWKAFFAEQVTVKAKELAENDDSEGVIKRDHYRRAARIAAQMLMVIVQDTDSSDGHQKAA